MRWCRRVSGCANSVFICRNLVVFCICINIRRIPCSVMTLGGVPFNVIAVSLIELLLLLSGETEEGVVMAAIACGLIPTNKILLHFTPSSISTVRKSRVINPASRRRFSASAVSLFPKPNCSANADSFFAACHPENACDIPVKPRYAHP